MLNDKYESQSQKEEAMNETLNISYRSTIIDNNNSEGTNFISVFKIYDATFLIVISICNFS